MARAPIVILGGSGRFGRLLAREIRLRSDRPLVLAARDPARVLAAATEVEDAVGVAADFLDQQGLGPIVAGAAACVLAAGPFQGLPLTPLEVCLAAGVPFVDLSDSPSWCLAVLDRGRAAAVPLLTGVSSLPGVASVLTRYGLRRVPDARRAETALFIGAGGRKGAASIASALAGPGEAVPGPGRRLHGWTGPRSVPFPSPIGRRLGWVAPTPCRALLPREHPGLREAISRVALEPVAAGFALQLLGAWRRTTGRPGLGLERVLASAARRSRRGSTAGAVRVALRGGRRPWAGTLLRETQGARIAVLAAVLAALDCAEGRIAPGPYLPGSWTDPERFLSEAVRSGCRFEEEASDRD